MSDTFIIFPNSLFAKNIYINNKTNVYIIEHPVYFTKYNYHKMKLVLHRASMRYYNDYIKSKYKCKVTYINFEYKLSKLFKQFTNKTISMYDPVDHFVMNHIKKLSDKFSTTLDIKDTPLFMTKINDLEKYANSKDKYLHSDFYKYQRKKHNILVKKNKPLKGKWSFDIHNRLSFPKSFKNNYIPRKQNNKYIQEAKRYINKHFPDNPGSPDIYVPIDHKGAKAHYKLFIKSRLRCFGPYQDAVDKNILFGCHSIISPMLNIGLLEPKYIIDYAEKYGLKNRIPMQSLEGFIRQVIGWREIQRLVYVFDRQKMEKGNFFNHRRKLDTDVWFYGEKSTGIIVMDDMIKKVLDKAYLHHIERLMYVGNFMLINQIHPDNVFEWFMTLFIDAYHWVMYGNVYAMSQFSTGKLMMTRPYFSSSAYIARMSNYKKHKNKYPEVALGKNKYEWFEVWDALYYNFIADNKKEFKKNYAIATQVKHWDKKTSAEKQSIKSIASKYMKKY